jgi:DNA-binding CsgD family transcriptional regulator
MTNLRAALSSTAAQVVTYGLLLAAGTFALGWLDLQRLTRAYSMDVFVTLIAIAFLVLGAWTGTRLFRSAPGPAAFDGNPKALETLGISPRELAVLQELAAGRANKEIAQRLAVSPNTVKTHTARLFEKLGAKRRTDAINRARELGLLP